MENIGNLIFFLYRRYSQLPFLKRIEYQLGVYISMNVNDWVIPRAMELTWKTSSQK